MDAAISVTTGLLGMTEKATIYVPCLEAIDLFKNAGLIGAYPEKLIGTAQITAEEMLRTSAKAATSLRDFGGSAGATTAETMQKATSAAVSGLNIFNKVEVQYNPKTLTILGIGGKGRSAGNGYGQNAETGVVTYDNKVSTTLSCELVFTNVNISDAFMTEDVSNMNINAAAGMVANTVSNLLGRSPSVQPMVDGFLSVITNQYTRQILFAWGSTVFRGELIRVDSQYKMFNKRGDPIVATVNISIRQAFDTVNQNAKEKSWRDAVKKTFASKDSLI